MKTEEIIEAIYSVMPYPKQITNLEINDKVREVRFTWRGDRFMVSDNLSVEEVRDRLLVGSSIAIVIEELLKRKKETT